MNPAPAGKLTDEELWNIGEKAGDVIFTMRQEDKNRFTRAVREAVEKECEARMMGFDPVACREEIARLTAELEQAQAMVGVYNANWEDVKAELAKANAELERLRPRHISTPPTLADVNNDGRVILLGDGDSTFLAKITDWNKVHESWRRWLPLNLAAYGIQTAEEVERERFEKWWAKAQEGDMYSREDVAFTAWQAARAAKEGEK